jgi:pilus assembly protein CpaD
MTRSISPRLMSARAPALAVLLGISAALGGCMHSKPANTDITSSIPDDYRQRHPIVIQEADHALVVLIGTGRGGLTAVQRAEVTAYAQAWQQDGTGPILVSLPVRTPNERAARDSLHQIQAMLSAAGIPPHGMRVQPYTPNDPRQFAAIRLSYPKVVADAGPCGTWPEDLGPTPRNRIYQDNKPYYNLGCAYQRNMAAMVANPSDLIQPRAETPSYGQRRTTVLTKYGKGEPTATEVPDSETAKVSDVGK